LHELFIPLREFLFASKSCILRENDDDADDHVDEDNDVDDGNDVYSVNDDNADDGAVLPEPKKKSNVIFFRSDIFFPIESRSWSYKNPCLSADSI